MTSQVEEMSLLRRQVEEPTMALSHPEVKQLLRTLAKGKTPMVSESREIPQYSKPSKNKEPDVDPYVGTSKEHEYQREVFGETPNPQPVPPPRVSRPRAPPPPPVAPPQPPAAPDSPQFSFMKDLDDMPIPDDFPEVAKPPPKVPSPAPPKAPTAAPPKARTVVPLKARTTTPTVTTTATTSTSTRGDSEKKKKKKHRHHSKKHSFKAGDRDVKFES